VLMVLPDSPSTGYDTPRTTELCPRAAATCGLDFEPQTQMITLLATKGSMCHTLPAIALGHGGGVWPIAGPSVVR